MRNWIWGLAFFASAQLYGQQFGISGQALLWFQTPRTYEVQNGNRTLRTGAAPAVGGRFELNYIVPGYSFPVSAYNGLGITFVTASEDSAVFNAEFKNYSWQSSTEVIGTSKTSVLNIGLRCGYEIPQDFDEFLLLHYGWGLGWTEFRTRYFLPEQSATFNYTTSDFKEETFDPDVDRSVSLEILFGGIYEFEKISAIAQYSLLIPMGDYDRYGGAGLRHGLNVGVFYTLKDLR